MALRDAVEDLANQMEEDLGEIDKGSDRVVGLSFFRPYLKGYLNQLRTALKASAGEPPTQQQQGLNPMNQFSSVHGPMQHIIAIEQARQELRAAKKKSEAQEGLEGMQTQIEIVGGELDGCFAPVDINNTPQGAKTIVSGQVYVFRDNKLYYDEEATNKLLEGGK